MDGECDVAFSRRGAAQLPAAGKPDGRSPRRRAGLAVDDVGPGERGHHHRGGIAQQLGRGRELDEAAVVEHADAIGECAGIVEGVRHQKRGKADVGEDVCELGAHLPACERIERAEGLVEKEHAGLASERTGERRALTLAARELPWVRGRQMRDSETFEQVGPLATPRERDVAGNRQVREQAVILRQIAHSTPLRAQVDTTGAVEPNLVIQGDPARDPPLETGHCPQERSLAGTRRPNERDRLRAGAQRDAKIERPPRDGDVDGEGVHERASSFAVSRIAPLTIISRTPMAMAWSRFASNNE